MKKGLWILLLPGVLCAEGLDPSALVQIAVEVVEVDVTKARELGIDWLSSIKIEELPASALAVGEFSRERIFGELRFLEEHGAADLMANPRLVTVFGGSAEFLAGGEIPYLMAAGIGESSSVEFRPYGVRLEIQPQPAGDKISLNVSAEVSQPDFTQGIRQNNTTLPAFVTRRVSSRVTLAQGSTITLAGMLQTQRETNRKGVPGLSKIPGLGAFFRRDTLREKRTSVLIFLTPQLLHD